MLKGLRDDAYRTSEGDAPVVVLDPTWDEGTIRFMIRRAMREHYGVIQTHRGREHADENNG